MKLKAGSIVELTFGIIAKPPPTIEWFKDGKELKSGAQQTIKHTADSTSIIIRDTTRVNTGA